MTYSANIQRLKQTSRANTQQAQQYETAAAQNETSWRRNELNKQIQAISVFSETLQREALRAQDRQIEAGREQFEEDEKKRAEEIFRLNQEIADAFLSRPFNLNE